MGCPISQLKKSNKTEATSDDKPTRALPSTQELWKPSMEASRKGLEMFLNHKLVHHLWKYLVYCASSMLILQLLMQAKTKLIWSIFYLFSGPNNAAAARTTGAVVQNTVRRVRRTVQRGFTGRFPRELSCAFLLPTRLVRIVTFATLKYRECCNIFECLHFTARSSAQPRSFRSATERKNSEISIASCLLAPATASSATSLGSWRHKLQSRVC